MPREEEKTLSSEEPKAKSILKPTNFAASEKRFLTGHTRHYIVDSGASFHLVSEDTLSTKEIATKVELDAAIEVSTANGEVEITHKCRVYVIELDLWVWAHLLETTVAVLSLGALCDEEGFDYSWKSKKIPTLKRGDLTVECYPTNYVPLIHRLLCLHSTTRFAY